MYNVPGIHWYYHVAVILQAYVVFGGLYMNIAANLN